MKSGIVQIYQLEENADYNTGTITDKPKIPFKVKIPLCLGALISHKHVLTTKLCFGHYERFVAAKMPYKQMGRCHLISNLNLKCWVLCVVFFLRPPNPANTGRAAVLYTAQLL